MLGNVFTTMVRVFDLCYIRIPFNVSMEVLAAALKRSSFFKCVALIERVRILDTTPSTTQIKSSARGHSFASTTTQGFHVLLHRCDSQQKMLSPVFLITLRLRLHAKVLGMHTHLNLFFVDSISVPQQLG